MKYLLYSFLFLSAAAFCAENQEEKSVKKESAPLKTKKIKPHFAGVRRGSPNKLKYIVRLPKAKKSADSEKQLDPAHHETR